MSDTEKLISEIERCRILHWNYRMYEEMPRELMIYGGHVEEIYQKENNLKCLPEDIDKLKSLRELHLRGNKIRHLPQSLDRWAML